MAKGGRILRQINKKEFTTSLREGFLQEVRFWTNSNRSLAECSNQPQENISEGEWTDYMNGALSKGAWEKKGEPLRGIGLVQGALIKVSKPEKVWEGGRGRQKEKAPWFLHLFR